MLRGVPIHNLRIWTDGGSRGNPGPAAIGVVIEKDGLKEARIGKCIGDATNNIAEYSAVLEAFEFVEANIGEASIEFFIDSELVVRQLNGQYKVKDANLKVFFLKIREKSLTLGGKIKFTHVRREQNREADELVNKALDSKC